VGNHPENNLAKLGYIRDLKYAAKHIWKTYKFG
jgi:hypothetical protein